MAFDPVAQVLASVKQAEQEAQDRAFTDFGDINEQLTHGPTDNVLTGSYTSGRGVWDIHFVDKINSDLLLVMQSRMKQLYLRTNQPTQTSHLPRRVKDLILLDYFPVHTVKDMGK